MRLFKLHDTNPVDGATEVTAQEARLAQHKGYGIFQLVNDFSGPRRLENLRHINYWYAEIDRKPPLQQLIESLPMHPTLVNETKNGYHLYFAARDASINRYKVIQQRICSAVGGDENAKDAARILRAPNYYHLKNANQPFLVRTIWSAPVSYREAVMLAAWPQHPDECTAPAQTLKSFTPTGDSFLDRIYSMNQGELLQRLSGHPAVCYEQYKLRRAGRGHNIYVNGRSTSCFVDTSGRIGSSDGGGPGVVNWLMWYGHSFKETMEILKEIMGEI